MQVEVENAIGELRRQFPSAQVTVNDDGQGGAHFFVEPIELGSKYSPSSTWVGAHIPAQYPYADIYPVFIASDVKRVDGSAFTAPITANANFQGRPALQISRRNNTAQTRPQTAVAKILKVLDFLDKLP